MFQKCHKDFGHKFPSDICLPTFLKISLAIYKNTQWFWIVLLSWLKSSNYFEISYPCHPEFAFHGSKIWYVTKNTVIAFAVFLKVITAIFLYFTNRMTLKFMKTAFHFTRELFWFLRYSNFGNSHSSFQTFSIQKEGEKIK